MLRPYQREASAAFDAALAHVDATLVVMPTGTGKTVVMQDVAARWGRRGRVLLLAHRVELLDQAAAKFAPALGYVPQVVQADRPVGWDAIDGGQSVFVGSVATVHRPRVLECLRGRPVGLLLIDEAHHACAKTYRKVADFLRGVNPACKVGGVTATPRRSDKRALGIVFDSTAYEMSSFDAIEGGWLVPPCEERVLIDDVDFSKVRLRTDDFGELDFDPNDLEAVLTEEKPLQAVAKPLVDAGARSWIVFTAGVKHATLLERILNRYRDRSAISLNGKDHPPGHPVRQQAVEDFRAGRLQFLVNCGVFTEGFDAPECGGVAIAKPTRSLAGLLQMAGRALRPLDGTLTGLDAAADRKAAIARSAKPEALILYFIPRAANIRVAFFADALAGNFDARDIALAKEQLAGKPGGQVVAEVRKARALNRLFEEEEARKRILADVEYRRARVGNAEPAAAEEDVSDIRRAGSSDRQIALLVSLGVPYATAAGYTVKQAGAVIERMKAKRCTPKQRAVLQRHGFSADVGFDEASRIIDEIAASGWRLRGPRVVG